MNFLSKSGTSVRGFRLTSPDYWIIEPRGNLCLCSAKNETDDERPSTRDITIEAEKIARLSARLGFASSFRQSRFVIGRKFERRGLFASVTHPPWMISWRRNIQQRLWQISIGYYAVLKRLKLAALTRPRDRGRCVSGKWMVEGEEKWREGYFEVKIDENCRRENKREARKTELEVVKRFRGNRGY